MRVADREKWAHVHSPEAKTGYEQDYYALLLERYLFDPETEKPCLQYCLSCLVIYVTTMPTERILALAAKTGTQGETTITGIVNCMARVFAGPNNMLSFGLPDDQHTHGCSRCSATFPSVRTGLPLLRLLEDALSTDIHTLQENALYPTYRVFKEIVSSDGEDNVVLEKNKKKKKKKKKNKKK